MIKAKDALQAALEYINDLLGDTEQPTNMALDKITSTSKNGWIVVISYTRSNLDPNSIAALFNNNIRCAKEIEIDSAGKVISMEAVKI